MGATYTPFLCWSFSLAFTYILANTLLSLPNISYDFGEGGGVVSVR